MIDSTKPIWQGEVKNCGMIMSTNALVAFQFCISHSNGIVISPVSLEESADLLKSHELSKQTNSHPSTSVECAKSVQVEMSVPTPLLTELVTGQNTIRCFSTINRVGYSILKQKLLRRNLKQNICCCFETYSSSNAWIHKVDRCAGSGTINCNSS